MWMFEIAAMLKVCIVTKIKRKKEKYSFDYFPVKSFIKYWEEKKKKKKLKHLL